MAPKFVKHLPQIRDINSGLQKRGNIALNSVQILVLIEENYLVTMGNSLQFSLYDHIDLST